MKNRTAFAVFCAILGNVIWGFGFLFTKMALNVAPDPNVMLAHRFILPTLLMLIPLLLGKEKLSFKGKKWGPISLLLLTQLTYYFFESYGILYTNATFSSLVLALVPVIAVITGALFLKEYPTKWQILFCIMPVVGVILISVAGKELGVVAPLGVICLILTLLSSVVYKTANRKASDQFSTYERTFLILAISSIGFGITGMNAVKWDVVAFVAPLADWDYLFPVLCLSLLSSIGANMLVNYALAHLSLFKVSAFGALSTLCSAVTGIVFLREPFDTSLILGAVLILAGVYLLNTKGAKK